MKNKMRKEALEIALEGFIEDRCACETVKQYVELQYPYHSKEEQKEITDYIKKHI